MKVSNVMNYYADKEGSEINFELNSGFKFEKIDNSLGVLFGLDELKLVGKTVWEVSDSFPEYKYSKIFERVITNKIPQIIVHFFPEIDSWQRWIIYSRNKGVGVVVVEITDEITNYLQIEESEIKLRAIVESTSESIMYLDRNCKIVFFNDINRKRLSSNFDEKIIEGVDFFESVNHEIKDSLFSGFNKALTGESVTLEVKTVGKEGDVWFESKMNPVRDANESIIGVTVIARNIQERKRSELAIIENEARLIDSEYKLKAILDNTIEAFVLMDLNYKVLCFNSAIKKTLFRFIEKELKMGDDYRDFVVSETMQLFLDSFEKAKNGAIVIVENETKGPGFSLWFEYRVNPVYKINGELMGITLTAKDITENKLAEINLKKNEEKLKKIFEFSSSPMLLLNSEAKIVSVNSEATKLFGYTLDEFKKINLSVLSKVEDKEHHLDLSGVTRGFREEDNYIGISTMLKKNGEVVITETRMNSFEFDNEDYSILSIHEVTDKIKSELKLKKYNHELTLLNAVNDIIIEKESEAELFEALCQVLIEKGDYKLAWLSKAPDVNKDEFVVTPMISYGETGYLEGLTISFKDDKLSKGPTGQALLSKKIFVNNNIYKNVNFEPWLQRAIKFDIKASCAVPIIQEDKVIAVLNIYSQNENAFDEIEVMSLNRIANNLALALRNIRIKNEKTETAYLLKERVKEITTIYEVNKLLNNEALSFEGVIKKAIEIIPLGWQHVDICGTAINFNGEIHSSSKFEKSEFIQMAERTTSDGKLFRITVSYQQDYPTELNINFLEEETELINALAEIFVVHYNKKAVLGELKKSAANLRSVIENTDVGHLLLDKDYTIIDFNQNYFNEYKDVTGIELKLNQNWLNFTVPHRREHMQKVLEQIISTKKPVEYDVDFPHLNKSKFFHMSIIPVIELNNIIGFSISATDITINKEILIERQKIIDELIQRNRDLEQFSYIVSHNIRSPVSTLIGFSNLLKLNLPQKDLETVFIGIENSAQKLDVVIKDLNVILNVKKDLSQQKVEINLNVLIESIKGGLDELISKTGTKIEYNFIQSPVILSVKPFIHSIFINLITNSIKYAKKDTKPIITIWAEKYENINCFYIKDNGKGIDLDNYKDELFGLYKRFNLEVEGKGMGLFMVKTQVNALGGSIIVDSKLGEGTTFKICLPI